MTAEAATMEHRRLGQPDLSSGMAGELRKRVAILERKIAELKSLR